VAQRVLFFDIFGLREKIFSGMNAAPGISHVEQPGTRLKHVAYPGFLSRAIMDVLWNVIHAALNLVAVSRLVQAALPMSGELGKSFLGGTSSNVW